MRLPTIIAVLALLGVPAASAQSVRYVTDSLKLEARSGPGTSNRILRMLDSGTRLTVHEDDNGWSRVTLPGGTEAWILSRYLMDQPSARDRLAEAEQGLENAREKETEVRSQLETLRAENEALLRTRDDLENEVKTLSGELADLKRTAGAAIALRDENRTLKQSTTALEERYRILEQDHATLRNARSRDWFLAGAGVLFGGMVLGLIIPKLRFRRRRSWGEL